ncbi:MAG: HEPN domain-containing protein [Caldilineaceae bacterium]
MDSDGLLTKAEQYLQSAQLLRDHGDYDSSVSRAYYAMFFVAEALLFRLGFSFSSHHAVTAAYGQHFAKTKILEPGFHRALLSAFDMRQRGDYQALSGLTMQDANSTIIDALAFLAAARQWLADTPSLQQGK